MGGLGWMGWLVLRPLGPTNELSRRRRRRRFGVALQEGGLPLAMCFAAACDWLGVGEARLTVLRGEAYRPRQVSPRQERRR